MLTNQLSGCVARWTHVWSAACLRNSQPSPHPPNQSKYNIVQLKRKTIQAPRHPWFHQTVQVVAISPLQVTHQWPWLSSSLQQIYSAVTAAGTAAATATVSPAIATLPGAQQANPTPISPSNPTIITKQSWRLKITHFLFTAATPGHSAAGTATEMQATTIQQQSSQSETTTKKTKQLPINHVTTG